ncbi:MAG: HypC/HybG/HupF family hydrogenase formation chaperone [Cyanobacteriota bacterium]|nr:HypC/HybG/HupF family hydrogenase formation chaperone [Cyanobacteriota bacterium]
MCLAVCGRIVAIAAADHGGGDPGGGVLGGGDPGLWRCAEVDFGGLRQQVSLACLPEARLGDRVLVHVGVALSVVRDDS